MWRAAALGKGHVVAKNVGESGVAVLALERGGAEEHFIDEDAKRPPVDGARVAAALDDFGRDVFFGTDKGVGAEVGDAGFGVNGGE